MHVAGQGSAVHSRLITRKNGAQATLSQPAHTVTESTVISPQRPAPPPPWGAQSLPQRCRPSFSGSLEPNSAGLPSAPVPVDGQLQAYDRVLAPGHRHRLLLPQHLLLLQPARQQLGNRADSVGGGVRCRSGGSASRGG